MFENDQINSIIGTVGMIGMDSSDTQVPELLGIQWLPADADGHAPNGLVRIGASTSLTDIRTAFQEKIEVDKWTWISLVVILAGVSLYVSHDMYFTGLGTPPHAHAGGMGAGSLHASHRHP